MNFSSLEIKIYKINNCENFKCYIDFSIYREDFATCFDTMKEADDTSGKDIKHILEYKNAYYVITGNELAEIITLENYDEDYNFPNKFMKFIGEKCRKLHNYDCLVAEDIEEIRLCVEKLWDGDWSLKTIRNEIKPDIKIHTFAELDKENEELKNKLKPIQDIVEQFYKALNIDRCESKRKYDRWDLNELLKKSLEKYNEKLVNLKKLRDLLN